MNAENADEGSWQTLESFRKEIDRIDEGILGLLSRRLAAAERIGKVKRRLDLEIADPARERRILERLSGRSRGRLDPEAIRTVFSGIFASSRRVQETPRVGFLGPEGTFSHQAARRYYGEEAAYLPLQTLEDVFDRVARAECHTGIVPLENASEGAVRDTLDLFARHDLIIRAEIRLPVRHHLLSHASGPESIRCLYSHPMALAQCRRWTRIHLPGVRTEPAASTAQAVGFASSHPSAAAVGSRLSGELFGVPVLQSGIQDRRDNVTRFVVLGRGPLERRPGGRDRTSLLLSVEHRPGALLRVLSPLAANGVNITRIDSRPRSDRAWEYLFFLDLDGHAADGPLAEALSEISPACTLLKVLGSYPREDDP